MSKRMSLIEGMRRDQDRLDPITADNFVKHGKPTPEKPKLPRPETQPYPIPQTAAMPPGLIPVNVRIRLQIAAALKTAALQRELQGIEPFTKREIVEQALEPWLKKNGYLS